MKNSSQTAFQSEIFKIAKEYIAIGWHVFPVHSVDENLKCTCGNPTCSDSGKHPRLPRGLKEASIDPAKIEAWFGPDAPMSNIGIVTGEISGITILDVDIGEGKGGAETWAELIMEHGEPQTLMAETGSGGMHALFKYNSALKTSSNTLGKGVDCRNDGGYIVAAPSRHRSGGVYKWQNWGDKLGTLPAHLSRRKETRGRKRKNDFYNGKYTLKQIESMLEFVPAYDRDLWRHVGVILGREFRRSDESWQVYNAWADKAGGKKGRNHDEIMKEAFYVISQEAAEKELSVGSIVKAAVDGGWAPKSGDIPIEHFFYYGPGNTYIYRPTASEWIATAVDAMVSPVNENGKIVKASEWLHRNQAASSMTCEPRIEEDYLKGHDCRGGEVVEVVGAALYNTYRKPTIELGDAKLAHPFVNHVKKVFDKEGDADQFLNYMAHRVQKPWEKPRFALLIAGGQGVGKDTAVEFCVPSIGVWNVANIDPSAFEKDFNEFAAKTLVRISEAANLHEMSKWAFNERTKVLIAGSPDTCEINPKYGKKFFVRMFCGVIITTNHLASGIYIPADDRRYDVIESATLQEMGLSDEAIKHQYFSDLWDWFRNGGVNHVAAYLTEKDISKFSADNGQRKTEAHREVILAGLEQHHWFMDILNHYGNPRFISYPMIMKIVKEKADSHSNKLTFSGKLRSALDSCGYFKYLNPKSKSDGRWYKPGCNGCIVYAKDGTSLGLDPRDEIKVEGELF